MNQCKTCGFENADENNFCKKCGTKLERKVTPKFCRNCGKETIPGTMFCTTCGKPLQMAVEENQKVEQPKTSVIANEKTEYANGNRKKNRKTTIIATVAVGIVLLAVAGIVVVSSGILETEKEDIEQEVVDSEQRTEKNDDTVVAESKATEQDTEVMQTEEMTEEKEMVNKNVDYSAPVPVQASVSASSSLNEETFKASSLIDGSANTAWGEGGDGLGEGEYVVYRFEEEKDIFGIAILPGNVNSAGDYYRYACPTELLVTAGDKTQSIIITSFSPDIEDKSNPYLYLELEEPVHTSEIMVAIADTRDGTEIETTCITEMYAYTYPTLENKEDFSVDAWKVTYLETSEYVLPESNSRYLDMSELEGLTAEECRLARNELYARHGRKFDDEFLRTYFEAKEWYEGITDAADFDESVLNEYEMANRDLIVEYETEQGYR